MRTPLHRKPSAFVRVFDSLVGNHKLSCRAGGTAALVAQIFNLPYRRFVIGRAPNASSTPQGVSHAQNEILRYSRLKICASALLAAIVGNVLAGGVKTGEPFPDLAGFKLEGKFPEATKGKVVLVDFWASWCEPCKQSFPVMEELHRRYAERGLVIIAINVDENRPDMEAFLKKNAATFIVLRDANQKLVEKTGIATMPSSFLIDRQGKVRFQHTGFRGAETRKKYEEEIEGLLK